MKRTVVKKIFEGRGGLGRDVGRWKDHLKGVPKGKRTAWIAKRQTASRGLTVAKERVRMRRFEGGARVVHPLKMKVEKIVEIIE